jgi:septum formation protein
VNGTQPTHNLRLILASGSPRRRQLLGELGLEFEVRPADIDETVRADESPADYVRRLAQEKACFHAQPDEWVLAADTTVVLDGAILGKPEDNADARRMLALIAGRSHEVLTGVALHHDGRTAVGVERTRVTLCTMSDHQLDWYSQCGEPDDKAGAYAIQGLGALFVSEIDGNYSNVVGLPLPLTRSLFEELGVDLLEVLA